MKMNLKSLRSGKSGFSLVELLVVIAVIGIMAGIAIPIIGKVNDSSKVARAKRNAQQVASVFSAAWNAGAFEGQTLTEESIITSLETGVDGTGAFNGTKFKISNVSTADAQATAANKPEWSAGNYLDWDDTAKILSYSGSETN